jgi:hypothetical protein
VVLTAEPSVTEQATAAQVLVDEVHRSYDSVQEMEPQVHGYVLLRAEPSVIVQGSSRQKTFVSEDVYAVSPASELKLTQ